MNDLEKIKQVVDDSPDINIFPSPDLRKDSFLAGLALFYSLKKLGKNVNFLIKDYPERFNFFAKETLQPPKADFVIAIKEDRAKFSRLFYEKTNGGLNLFLKTNGGQLKQEDIVLKPLVNPLRNSISGDNNEAVLVTVGIEHFSKIKRVLDVRANLIVNIDNQLGNENYGQFNLTEINSPALCEIVFDVICSLDENLIDKEVADVLLTGIIEGTLNFQDPKTNISTFQRVGCLLEKGADLKKITDQLYGFTPESSLRLLGAVLSKINVLKEENFAWALLKQDDFQRTHSSSADLKFALKKFVSGIFPFQHFLCLWEEASSLVNIRGVFYSPDEKLLEKIKANFEGVRKGQGILFQTKQANLQNVKDDILEMLEIVNE